MNTISRTGRIIHQGFTLIELMIAMTLGLFLLLGLTNVFLAQRQAYRTNENLAHLQNNARVAFELMAREIRESGVTPCGSRVVGNVVNVVTGPPSSTWLNWSAGGIVGYEGNATVPDVTDGTGTAQRIAGTDAVILRSGSLFTGAVIAAHAASANAITVNTASHGFVNGEILVACDYKQAAIFQATSTSTAAIGHGTGGTPGNCVNDFPLDCSSGGSAHSFEKNGFVTPLSVTVWYIGNNDRGGRSLFRILNGGTPQEIAEGISDIQLQYLTRTGTTPAVNYVDASSVASWTNSAPATVIAVRIVLDLESKEAVGTDAATLKRQLIHVVTRRGYREIL